MEHWLSFARIRLAGLASSVIVVVLAPLVLFLAQPVAAASFDCAKASTAVEKTICGDVELSKLDEALVAAYARVLAQATVPNSLRSEQRKWLRDIRDACPDAACVKAAYETRIAELAKIAEAPDPANARDVGPVAEGFVALDELGNPLDEDGLPIGPGNLLPGSGYEYQGVRIAYSVDDNLCSGIALGLRQHSMSPVYICGVPFPKASPPGNFFGFWRVPPWRSMDPANNIDLVKEMFFWANDRERALGKEDSARQKLSGTIIPDIFDKLWATSEERVKALIAAGRVQLQRSQFDYDNDGADETVYRMTTLLVLKRGQPPVFGGRPCRTVVPGWSDAPMSYIVEKDGQWLWRGGPASLFRYAGKTYRFNTASGTVNKLGQGLGVSTTCRFSPENRKAVRR